MAGRHKKTIPAIEGREVEEAGVRKADAFKQLTAMEQVREKPSQWLGGITPEPITMSCFDGVSIKRKEVPDYIEALDRLWNELVSNSVDNCLYSTAYGVDPGEIYISLSPTNISIENSGSNVPVEKMSNDVWIPEMLWGSLFSSSHYAEAKKKYKESNSAGGTNGVGAVLVNIFSDRFEVLVEDPETHRRFEQVWSRGKPLEIDGVPREPKITTSKRIIKTKIKVTYTLDFAFFGLEKYSPLMLELFTYYAVTASFVAKVPVTITDEAGVSKRYDVRMISDYATMFPEFRPSPSIKRIQYHALSPEAMTKGVTYEDAVKKHLETPRIEVLIVDELADEAGEVPEEKGKKNAKLVRASSRRATGAYQLSFVNGISTTQHGVHVDEMIKAFFGSILTELKISLANGRRHISFLLSVRLSNPAFSGNAKTVLKSPKPLFDTIPPAVLKALKSWTTMARLQALNEAELMVGLKKSDGKKLRRLTQITELDDANYAGTSASHNCTLIIVEGGSASTYPEILRDLIPGGRDTHGILLLRGKPLNVLNASIAQLSGETGSQVYPNFKQALGLQDGLDYSTNINFKKLRYGHVLIATDADCDGWHILCLLLLMFHARFPSLVNRGYISYLRTPVLRVPGAQGLTFFTKRAYLEWEATARAAGGQDAIMARRKPKYYKGLGSSNDKDVAEDLRSKRGRLDVNDDDGQAKESLDLGFNEKRTGDRKRWLALPVHGEFLDTDASTEGISHFVHTGLKLYSLDNIQRAIPNIMDGMKESMRKALAAGIKKFGIKSGNRHLGMTKEERKAAGLKSAKSATYEVPPEAKVFQIIGSTTEHFCYHHGEPILGEVISNMCKSYVGTNNITWFQPVSSFGTIDSGKAPDPRYASLGPAWWWAYAYHTADVDLVDYVYDEGNKCEPKFMLPVICWALCNQADGVGTGYSTRVPGHNIEEIILSHLCLLEGQVSFPKLIPWWRGFRGTVSVVPRSKARRMVVVEKSVDVEDIEGAEIEATADAVGTEIEPEASPKPPEIDIQVPKKRGRKSKAVVAEPTDEASVLEVSKEDPMVCIVDGTYIIQGNTVIVTALPLRTFKEFGTILAGLIDKKIVSDFRNRSVGENIRFEIEMVVDDEGKLPPGNLMKLFRLRKIITMSNLVLLDENGLPKRYKSAEDILQYFHSRRLDYYGRRREAIIEGLRQKLKNLEQKMQVIRFLLAKDAKGVAYVEKLSSVKEEQVLAEIEAKLPGIPPQIYKGLNVRHLNEDQIASLTEEVNVARADLEAVEATTKEVMWKKDLLAFLREYRATYGSDVSEAFRGMQW